MSNNQGVRRLAIGAGALVDVVFLFVVLSAPSGFESDEFGWIPLQTAWGNVAIGFVLAFILGWGSVRLIAWIIDGFRGSGASN